MYVTQGVKSIFDKVTFWPQLIFKAFWLQMPACNGASDYPCTFYATFVFA